MKSIIFLFCCFISIMHCITENDLCIPSEEKLEIAKNYLSISVDICIKLGLNSLAVDFKGASIYILTHEQIKGYNFIDWYFTS